ncbi:hypothetical protein CLU96_4817 [Chryseobacterium sp. 52]|uniref:hypothetical protein n=1 Tax=Chryseobacterium sp. 52 TaxID=2035213 RepID=UPI000C4CE61A|nr:hypothetical protein [Chryseobacterium sp. 52]PIF47748.1 hypothetical protein CLU96_4817 [Chryseobacterium sp. 52]
MKKNIIICLLLLCNWLYSQNQMKDSYLGFTPKTPDISSLGKYIDKPISLSSGSVNVSVPIYTLPINSNISIPINLQYNTQGIKVSEVASSVGQGWNLSPMGTVTRSIRGKRDNYNDSPFYLQSIATAKNSLMNNSTGVNTDVWLDQNAENVDLEPDEFNVSLFNMNFKFFYDFSSHKFVSTPLNNIKIIPTLNNYGNIVDFKIIDGSGNTYFFGKSDDNDSRFEVIDEVSSTSISNDSAFSSGTDPQFNTWLLVKITTNDNKTVRFYYDDNSISAPDLTKQDVYLTSQYKYFANNFDFFNGKYDVVSWSSGNPVVIGNKYPISSEIAKTKDGKVYNIYSAPVTLDKIIKRIVYENTEIEFIKSTIARKDFNSYSLDKIKIKDNNNLVKTYQLNHGYFNVEFPTPMNDFSRSNNYIFTPNFDRAIPRLKLDGVSEYDKTNQLISKHNFEYFPGQLPSRLSFAQDFFGYYNGHTENTELIPNINFKYANSVKSAGTANRAVREDYSKIGMLKKITYPTEGSTEFDYENHTYQAINDINEVVIGNLFSMETKYVFFASEQASDPNTGEQLPPEMNYEMNWEFEEDTSVDLNTQIEQVFDENHGANNSYNIIIYRKVNGNWQIFTLMSHTIDKTVFFPKGEYLLTAHRDVLTVNEGGLFDSAGGFTLMMSFLGPVKNNQQPNTNPESIQNAGGLRIKSIVQKENNVELLRTEYSYNETVGGKVYSTGMLHGYPLLVTENFYEGINKFYGVIDYPFRNSSSSNIIYGQVTEISVDQQNNKKIKKEYFFENNAPLEATDMATIEHRTRTPYMGWKLGNLKKTLFYKQNDNGNYTLIQKDTIIYDRKNLVLNENFGVRIEPRDRVLLSTFGATNPDDYVYKTDYKFEYYPLFSDFSFESKKKVTELFENKTLITSVDNIYSNPHYQLSNKKTTFPDNSLSEISYAYAYEKGNQLMISKNLVEIPLEIITNKMSGNNTKVLSKTETVYPKTTAEIINNTNQLVLPLSVISYDIQNNMLSMEVTYDKYDSKGNLQQYTTKAGISTTIIWGYDKTQPIAKIEGAKLSDISQSLIETIVDASISDAQLGTSASEQALINALDLFRNNSSFSGFQISTYTYDPLIGVRSITPPSGIREVYIYDTANRLKEIRENSATGKILKEYQYNYKN